MHESEEENGHHDYFKVDFGFLWKVWPLNRRLKPLQAQKLEKTEGLQETRYNTSIAAGNERCERHWWN